MSVSGQEDRPTVQTSSNKSDWITANIKIQFYLPIFHDAIRFCRASWAKLKDEGPALKRISAGADDRSRPDNSPRYCNDTEKRLRRSSVFTPQLQEMTVVRPERRRLLNR